MGGQEVLRDLLQGQGFRFETEGSGYRWTDHAAQVVFPDGGREIGEQVRRSASVSTARGVCFLEITHRSNGVNERRQEAKIGSICWKPCVEESVVEIVWVE